MSRRPAPQPDPPLAASPDSPPADSRYTYDLERLRLITTNRQTGATWNMIAQATGTTGKLAKRDYKRAARRTGRTWRLQDNAENTP